MLPRLMLDAGDAWRTARCGAHQGLAFHCMWLHAALRRINKWHTACKGWMARASPQNSGGQESAAGNVAGGCATNIAGDGIRAPSAAPAYLPGWPPGTCSIMPRASSCALSAVAEGARE